MYTIMAQKATNPAPPSQPTSMRRAIPLKIQTGSAIASRIARTLFAVDSLVAKEQHAVVPVAVAVATGGFIRKI